jgi:hypothetical protein
VLERRLVTVVGSVRLDGEEDMKRLIPAALPDPFTTTDLAAGLNRPMRPAQQMAYCLRESGIVEIVGKRGNSLEYRLR